MKPSAGPSRGAGSDGLSVWTQLRRRLPRTMRHRVLLVMLALAVALLAVVIMLLVLWQSRPGYWTQNEKLLASDNATLMQLASTLEQRTLRELSGTPQQQTQSRTLDISFDEINAWLSVKLEDYLANRQVSLPSQIRHPMLSSHDGRLVIAFEYTQDGWGQVISLELEPIFEEPDGRRFRMKLHRTLAGQLPLPVQRLKNQIARHSHEAGQRLEQLLDTLGNQWHEAVQNHPGDARLNLRLTDIQIHDEGLRLTLQPEPRQTP